MARSGTYAQDRKFAKLLETARAESKISSKTDAEKRTYLMRRSDRKRLVKRRAK